MAANKLFAQRAPKIVCSQWHEAIFDKGNCVGVQALSVMDCEGLPV
jgi:hypothetical protein